MDSFIVAESIQKSPISFLKQDGCHSFCIDSIKYQLDESISFELIQHSVWIDVIYCLFSTNNFSKLIQLFIWN